MNDFHIFPKLQQKYQKEIWWSLFLHQSQLTFCLSFSHIKINWANRSFFFFLEDRGFGKMEKVAIFHKSIQWKLLYKLKVNSLANVHFVPGNFSAMPLAKSNNILLVSIVTS
jgi:hypothetical protein